MTVSMVKCDFIPSVRRSIWNYARVILTVSERGVVLFFCPLVQAAGRAKMMLTYFSGTSQNQDAASIRLF